MTYMIRENCGTHSITLLLSFMCGSLLSLIYLITNVPFRFAEDMPVIAAAASFSVGALTCGTACCIMVQPLSTTVLGCAVSFEMYSAVTELLVKEAAVHMGIMAVLIPLHFLVCSYGMAQSGIAREAMRQVGTYSRKQTLYTYAIMLAGLAAAALLIRYILRI